MTNYTYEGNLVLIPPIINLSRRITHSLSKGRSAKLLEVIFREDKRELERDRTSDLMRELHSSEEQTNG